MKVYSFQGRLSRLLHDDDLVLRKYSPEITKSVLMEYYKDIDFKRIYENIVICVSYDLKDDITFDEWFKAIDILYTMGVKTKKQYPYVILSTRDTLKSHFGYYTQ